MKKLLLATILWFGLITHPAWGALLFYFTETGNGVTMISSGSIDTSALVSTPTYSWGSTGLESNITHGIDIMGSTAFEPNDSSLRFHDGTDFSAWTTGNPWSMSSFSPPWSVTSGSKGFSTHTFHSGILVPGFGFHSSRLVGSIWTPDQQWLAAGHTFASLWMNPGTYTVTDAVSGESITYQIGGVIPEPSIGVLFLSAGAVVLSLSRRRV